MIRDAVATLRVTLKARFRRWCHCLRCMWSGGCGVTAWDHAGHLCFLGCTCGRVFYVKKGHWR